MEKPEFARITKGSETSLDSLFALVMPYMREIESHYPDRECVADKAIHQFTHSMVDRQGPPDRYLELCALNGSPIGFYHAKIDHIGHMGYIKPEYGCIMEFYISPEYRRKKYGSTMYQRLISHFNLHSGCAGTNST